MIYRLCVCAAGSLMISMLSFITLIIQEEKSKMVLPQKETYAKMLVETGS